MGKRKRKAEDRERRELGRLEQAIGEGIVRAVQTTSVHQVAGGRDLHAVVAAPPPRDPASIAARNAERERRAREVQELMAELAEDPAMLAEARASGYETVRQMWDANAKTRAALRAASAERSKEEAARPRPEAPTPPETNTWRERSSPLE